MKDKHFKGLGNLVVLDNAEMIMNPFSGETVMLEPDAVAVHDYIKGSEMMGHHATMAKALEYFRSHWPKEYMILLD